MNESNLSVSPSTQRYSSHPVHAALDTWRKKLLQERPDKFRELDGNIRDAYVRLRWVLRYLRTRLDRLNPMLAPIGILNNINQQLSQLQTHWQNYVGNPTAQWQNLNSYTDGLLSHICALPTTDGKEAWIDYFEELRADMVSAIRVAQETLQKLENEAETTKGKFQQADQKLKELESEIQAQKTRLDQMLTQHSTAFNTSEQERMAKFNESQEQKKNQFEMLVKTFEQIKSEVIEKHQAELKSIEELGNKRSQEIISQINTQLDKAVEIVGTIVKTTMSGNYQIVANREYKNAWIMRGVAILSFLAMGGMVIWAVSSMDLSKNGIDWSTFAFRISLGFAFLIPGIYCAKESSRHWNAEKHNRRLALELAALDPFIVKLDEAKQKEIIEKKADEYFGRKSPQESGEDVLDLKDIYLRADKLIKVAERRSEEHTSELQSH